VSSNLIKYLLHRLFRDIDQGEAAIDLSSPELKDSVWEQRFDNWAAWCRSKGFHQARAFSVEGCYSGPQGKGYPYGWGEWENGPLAPLEVRRVIDIPDAIHVNRAYTRLAITAETHARIIRVMTFDRRMSFPAKCRFLGYRQDRIDAVLGHAKRMLRNIAQGLDA
jgi:hypothetical protein